MLYPNFISDNRVFVASVIIISRRSWSDVCFLVLDFFTTFAKEDVIYGPVNKCAVLSRMLHQRYDSYPLKSQRDVYRNRCHASFLHCSNVVWLSVGLVLIDKHQITYTPYFHNHFFVESYTKCLSVRACVFNQKNHMLRNFLKVVWENLKVDWVCTYWMIDNVDQHAIQQTALK